MQKFKQFYDVLETVNFSGLQPHLFQENVFEFTVKFEAALCAEFKAKPSERRPTDETNQRVKAILSLVSQYRGLIESLLSVGFESHLFNMGLHRHECKEVYESLGEGLGQPLMNVYKLLESKQCHDYITARALPKTESSSVYADSAYKALFHKYSVDLEKFKC